MIIHKLWVKKTRRPLQSDIEETKEGWFLFGFIPLYIKTTHLKY